MARDESDDGWISKDRISRKNMERGSAQLLNAILIAQRGGKPDVPRGLFWQGTGSGNFKSKQKSETKERAERHIQRRLEQKEAAREKVVTRDPCPCCGTRMDLHGEICS